MCFSVTAEPIFWFDFITSKNYIFGSKHLNIQLIPKAILFITYFYQMLKYFIKCSIYCQYLLSIFFQIMYDNLKIYFYSWFFHIKIYKSLLSIQINHTQRIVFNKLHKILINENLKNTQRVGWYEIELLELLAHFEGNLTCCPNSVVAYIMLLLSGL